MQTKEHVIFFDVDGTLNDPVKHEIPKSVPGALKMLKEAGYLLGIATGRNIGAIPEPIRALADWDCFVCNNGQAIYNGNHEKVYAEYMPEELVRRIIKSSEDVGFSYCLEVKTDKEVFLYNKPTAETVDAYCFFGLDIPPYKENMPLNNVITLLIYRKKSDGFADLEAMEELMVVPGMVDYADIALAGFNKFTGIQTALKLLEKEKSIAVGDSLNDIEMLDGCDVGIAVDGGAEEVRKYIDFLSTTPANDGILNAVKWILENNFA